MHNNYYFLNQLSAALTRKLSNALLAECFSQNKDELILIFLNGQEEYYIKAHLHADFCCLSFPDGFNRARKNSVNLFGSLIDLRVKSITQYKNERCFSLTFEQDYTLLFKMHGNRSNIILFHQVEIVSLFRKKLIVDNEISLDGLNISIDQSKEAFLSTEGDINQLFPTFGAEPKRYLKENGYHALSMTSKWDMVRDLVDRLESGGQYFICQVDGKNIFSMVEIGDTVQVLNEPIEALNQFFGYYIKHKHLADQKQQIVSKLQKAAKQGTSYIQKTERKLKDINDNLNYELLANIIMANLHTIKTGTEEVELINFYDNTPIKIKLKRHLSPQKNAEQLYRKSKNQKIEIQKLEQTLTEKKKELSKIERDLNALRLMSDIKEIKALSKSYGISNTQKESTQVKPFHEFEYSGYKIWVGKNSKSNDTLTQEYSYKEDLWLHAKDVPGSHVVIKHQAGKNFPKPVIEKAAQLAAYYSKRKNDSLCPVTFTPRKFVRKRKGAPAGQVVVDKEQVMLVPPEKW
ncbi:MAG: NFACT RNA binding domain-containing protein [Bacteroidota bacterium]